MPVVKEIRQSDLEGQYILVFDTGIVQFKDAVKNTIIATINPSAEYTLQISKGGLAKAEKDRTDQVDELLQALEIDITDARARFLATSAVTGKSGDNLRSFLALVSMFQPDQKVSKPVWQILLSDRAYTDYMDRMVHGTTGMAEWMQEEELAKTPDFENIVPHDNLTGTIEKVIKVHPEPEQE